MSMFVSAKDCGSFPSVLLAEKSLDASAKFGSVITYTCLQGYWFSPGIFTQTASCQADGRWDTMKYNDCKSKRHLTCIV